MPITYTIAIDLNDDGDYLDLAEAISADVLAANWRLGLQHRYDPLAAASVAEIRVRNRTGTFSPERNSLLPGQRLRIQSDDGTTTRTHFLGEIVRVEPEAGEQSSQQATLIAHGRERELAQNRVRIPPMVDARADEVLNAIFSRLTMRYAVLDGFCIIDRAGQNVIDSTTIFAAEAVTKQFDTGQSVFAYVGDTWGDGIAADAAIREVVLSEGGRFFFNRAGAAVFYNRHHLVQNLTTQATFSNAMEGAAYVYGADRVTQVDVRLTPREIGAANTLLFALAQPTKIRRGQTRILTARYEIDGEPVGLLSALTFDYQALLTKLPGGLDLSKGVRVLLLEAGFSAATIEVRNRAGVDVYLHALNLYGTPLITGDLLALSASDPLPTALYGLNLLVVDVPVLTDVDEAAAIAEYEFQRRSEPRGVVVELQTSTRAHPTQTLALTLFDRIQITEAQTGHSGFYRIVREAHKIDRGGARHRVAWLLEPDESEIFFVIDTHSVNGAKVLAPR